MRCYRHGAGAVRSYIAIGPAAAATICLLWATSAWAAGPEAATTSTAARNEAIAAIPLERVDPAYRRAVQDVLSDPSVYRRLPTEVVDCQGPMFTFLAQNPEVLVGVWRRLGVSNVTLIRTGAKTFKLADGSGTVGRLVIVEENCGDDAQNRIVMYSQGRYDGRPFNKPVGAECVLLLRSGSIREDDGREFVAARLDTFLKIDRASIELFAKALHPLVGRTADKNFTDTMKFVGNLSYTAERRPEAIELLAVDLENVGPARKQRFASLAYECSERGAGRRVNRPTIRTAQQTSR